VFGRMSNQIPSTYLEKDLEYNSCQEDRPCQGPKGMLKTQKRFSSSSNVRNETALDCINTLLKGAQECST
jgi:hypothetical protein